MDKINQWGREELELEIVVVQAMENLHFLTIHNNKRPHVEGLKEVDDKVLNYQLLFTSSDYKYL